MPKRRAIVHLVWLFLILGQAYGYAQDRPNAVAGSFYPAEKSQLESFIDSNLNSLDKPTQEKHLFSLVVPHAGYVFSGKTAAHAYKQLEGGQWDTVVLIGPSHYEAIPGASIWNEGIWETPLGDVPVATDIADAIRAESPLFLYDKKVHLKEHSLEVQVPFLQRSLSNFKIVPILVNNPSLENSRRLAEAIWKHIQDKNVLVIASSDLSHYLSLEETHLRDGRALEQIQKMDAERLLEDGANQKLELCGIAAVATSLELSRLAGAADVEKLYYSDSSVASGDTKRVVGYAAVAVYKSESQGLNIGQKEELLKLSRTTLEEFVRTGSAKYHRTLDSALLANGAAFVTLKDKNNNLRGCIGSIVSQKPLFETIEQMTIAAASHDPRFTPVKAEELSDLKIEISVLSEPHKTNVEQIDLKKQGVILKQESHAGVFLPKVAEETGWDKNFYLEELCSQKAGLGRDCWKDPKTQFYSFTSEDFKE